MKKLYLGIIKIGKIFVLVDLLIIISVVIQSFSIKGKVNYGNRCYISYDFTPVTNYTFEGIELVSSELKCNTFVINYKSVLDNKSNILFLNDLSKVLYENNIESDVNVTIVSINHQIIASIVDYKVNYVESLI